MMKTTLFLAAVAAGAMSVSTAAFAQVNGVMLSQSYGDASAQAVSPGYVVPYNRFTRSDFGYSRAFGHRHATRALRGREPAPGQEF